MLAGVAMEDGDQMRQIGDVQVALRTLDGQSLAVGVQPDHSLDHLKTKLQQLHWPVSDASFSSRSFSSSSLSAVHLHIYHRGRKLAAGTKIKDLSMKETEFLVCIPYAKKKSTNLPLLNDSRSYLAEEGAGSLSEMKDYRDHCLQIRSLAGDIPQIRGKVSHTGAEVGFPDTPSHDAALTHIRLKRRLSKDCNTSLHSQNAQIGEAGVPATPSSLELQTALRQCGKNGIKGTFQKVMELEHEVEFIEDENQHSTLSSGIESKRKYDSWNRTKRQRANLFSELPPVLERLNKVFASLNTIYGFLQKQHMQATWHNVKHALQDLCAEGEPVSVKDIENLATLCPKVVLTSSMVGEGDNASFHINLVDPSKNNRQNERQHQVALLPDDAQQSIGPSDFLPNSGRKLVSDKAIRNAVERRQFAFEDQIRELVRVLQASYANRKSELKEVVLEELLSTAKMLLQGSQVQDKKLALPRPPRHHKKLTRCMEVNDLSAMEMVDHLKKKLGCLNQIVHCQDLQSREPLYGQLVCDLLSATKDALKKIGITQLYRHQTEAINAAISRINVIVATSTASGKSICYNVPVLEQLLRSPVSCALYLFPTKALAQDQLRSLEEFTKGITTQLVMGVYDGDTMQKQRHLLRDHARLIVSNPDMLHMSILPSHRQFDRFLSNLRYVIIDEAHAYRGAFGCHTALILRRLRRLCHHLYGTEPTFVICSATIANPREHAMELVGLRQLQVVQDDGSPSGGKYFLLWNPPPIFLPPRRATISRNQRRLNHIPTPEIQTKRSSPVVEVASILAEMVQHGLRCIAFCKTRKLCELVLNYTREILKESSPDLIDTVCAYRAGYTPQERRAIESDLFGGRLRGVAATNALELGVDVGSLDATLHLGFPGTVASLWQQAGRAGRREKPSLSIYVAFGSPLDQHFMKNPQKLFCRPIEHAQVDAYNYQVLEQQLTCAAYELPLEVSHDEEYFGSGLPGAVTELVKKGLLGQHPNHGPQEKSWCYIGEEELPSSIVSMRGIDREKYTVINQITNETIEEVEASKAFFQVYEGAVYIHQGKTYLVKTLDIAAKVASCIQADVKYYTKTRDFTDIHVLGGELAYPRRVPNHNYPTTSAQANMCKVTTRWIGFRRIWQGSNETFDSVDLFLPPASYESQAAWIRVPHEIRQNLQNQGLPFRAGLHAASHALLNVMPLYIMCTSSDLGTECANPQDTRYYPERLLVFDRHAGGFGIAAQARPLFAELLQAAVELLIACDCASSTGCPDCVQHLSCGEYNEVIDKHAAIEILKGIIHTEDMHRAQDHSITKAPSVNLDGCIQNE
ncbi:hypothetical protein O6H91_Y016800 [Diphasiastrum complanatum]|nr:hypothetical protein O6H91_Y016800 [Diphasiastrum complanatum]KAJ7298097.1 hypothetical protein O6H91_Y016800 [Diphasiastrum complanatum]KAJ7298099.1 hypothetical protein O6H91_Y016800 [Diphasiastrum complanatum]KAJ7298102.1 hypothetical protein O6H91_Y016800 [Diphasiastrum complanatum]KAJ7298103.1 hypothetical protein O6H91_Y016800 [Diphasiastrum complanatum]